MKTTASKHLSPRSLIEIIDRVGNESLNEADEDYVPGQGPTEEDWLEYYKAEKGLHSSNNRIVELPENKSMLEGNGDAQSRTERSVRFKLPSGQIVSPCKSNSLQGYHVQFGINTMGNVVGSKRKKSFLPKPSARKSFY